MSQSKYKPSQSISIHTARCISCLYISLYSFSVAISADQRDTRSVIITNGVMNMRLYMRR